MPAAMSFMVSCAARPRATPIRPAEASRAGRLTPLQGRATIRATVQIRVAPVTSATAPRVARRRIVRSVLSSGDRVSGRGGNRRWRTMPRKRERVAAPNATTRKMRGGRSTPADRRLRRGRVCGKRSVTIEATPNQISTWIGQPGRASSFVKMNQIARCRRAPIRITRPAQTAASPMNSPS